MYLRFTQRGNADGSVVRYAALAHNRRVEGRVKPDVLMNLSRVDQLEVDGLRRLTASITKHFGDSEGGGGSVSGPSDGTEAGLAAGAAPMEVLDSRPIGAAWLLDGLWDRLRIATAIKQATDGRRFTTNMERVLFALVANRAIEPMSKFETLVKGWRAVLSTRPSADVAQAAFGSVAGRRQQCTRAPDVLARRPDAGSAWHRRT